MIPTPPLIVLPEEVVDRTLQAAEAEGTMMPRYVAERIALAAREGTVPMFEGPHPDPTAQEVP